KPRRTTEPPQIERRSMPVRNDVVSTLCACAPGGSGKVGGAHFSGIDSTLQCRHCARLGTDLMARKATASVIDQFWWWIHLQQHSWASGAKPHFPRLFLGKE